MRPLKDSALPRGSLAILFSLLCWGLFGLVEVPALAISSVTLGWEASPDPDIKGYNVYYGLASGIYNSHVFAGNVTNVTMSSLTDGTVYFFVARSLNTAGLESGISDEVSYATQTASSMPSTSHAPTLNPVSDRSVNENAGPRVFNLSGITSGTTNPNPNLTVRASSSDPSLIPTPLVSYTSPNSSGTLTLGPATSAVGTAIITVTVDNGVATFSRSFNMTIIAVTPPLFRLRQPISQSMFCLP